MAAPFDIWDQAVLTDIVLKPLQRRGIVPGGAGYDPYGEDASATLGNQIAPFKTINSRTAKIRTYEVKPFGKGQFKAPDATPALYKPDQTWSETVMELVLLEEMERISSEDWIKLNSADENVRRGAGVDLVDRARILQIRNERLTEWMRWQAFAGSLTVTYPSGSSLVIDYGLAATHKPTATNLWSDLTNGDPIADLQTWSQLLANDSGFWGTKVHMTAKTFDYIIRNSKVAAALIFNAPATYVKRPTRTNILELLNSWAVNMDIVIYDDGFRDTGATGPAGPTTLTKYLPDGKVLMTTDYTIYGVNIADTLDGQVVVMDGYNSMAIRTGSQSEVIIDPMSKNTYFRVASARIPRINMPECFLYATVAAS